MSDLLIFELEFEHIIVIFEIGILEFCKIIKIPKLGIKILYLGTFGLEF